MRPRSLLVLVASLASACDSSGTVAGTPTLALTATPSRVSMFGNVSVQLEGDFSSLGKITSVTVNGVSALDVKVTGSTLVAYVQGAPAPGAAHILLTGSKGTAANDDALTFDGTRGGAPGTWAAFGASLTQGFQSGGVDSHGQTMSWAAQVARAAGAYLALPLVVDAFLPGLEPSAFVSNCDTMWSESSIAASILSAVSDPATNQIDLRRPRLDPTLHTRNFAVGGATVSDILHPATGGPSFVERVVEVPDGDPSRLAAALTMSQLDRLAALDPDVAISGDLLANDSDSAVTQSDDLHPEQMTPSSVIAPELETLASRLGKLHGDYFIGNLLPIDALPNVTFLRAQRIAAGTDTPASFDVKLQQVRTIVTQYNDALAKALAPYPNLHLVDLWANTTSILAHGIDVGGVHLTGEKFGGLLSLDFVHFTDTGYAVMANSFIDAMNAAKGWHVPRVDEAQVLAHDPLSPASLAADGVHCPSLPPSSPAN